MRKRVSDCAFLTLLQTGYATVTSPSEWPLKTCAQSVLAYVYSPPMQMSRKISGVTGPKFTNCSSIFSSTVLTQHSALRSVHPLSNERGDILRNEATSVKRKPAGGIAMPGGLITISMTRYLLLLMSISIYGLAVLVLALARAWRAVWRISRSSTLGHEHLDTII